MSGRPNGVSKSQPYDRWFRYAAGFSPASLASAFTAIGVGVGDLVVDPFLGVGTTLTYGRERGIPIVGIETHPLIAEFARLKIGASEMASRVEHGANEIASIVVREDCSGEAELVKRSFDPETLSVLVGIRSAISLRADSRERRYLRLALTATLRDIAQVKVGWPYQRPSVPRQPPHADPVARFQQRALQIGSDLRVSPTNTKCFVFKGDSRRAEVWRRARAKGVIAGCVSSPPYLNNFDYADATRLELYFLREANTWAEMCAGVRSGMVLATTQQVRVRDAQRAWRFLDQFPRTKSALAPLRNSLGYERCRRERGKEYDLVLPAYFADIARVLRNLRNSLRPGGRSAWVVGDSAPYGVYVDTPALLGLLASELGFRLLLDEHLRTRGLRWATNGSRHSLTLSERLVVFEAV